MKQALYIFFIAVLRVPASIISLGGSPVFLPDFETLVPVGSYISVGYFEQGFNDFSNLTNYSWDGLESSFYTEVSTGIINPTPGEWAGGGNATDIEGAQLFVWVFNSPSVPDNLGDTEFGLFTGASSAWIALGDGDLFHPQFNFLTVDSADIVLHGSSGEAGLALAPAQDALVSVPEPDSMAVLFGIAALIFPLARRFRRH